MIINGKYADLDGKIIDRFHLEQKIMEAWHVVDDVRLLYSNIEEVDEDTLQNALIGIETMAEMRFQSLWNTFEQCITNGVFNEYEGYTIHADEDVAKVIESLRQKKNKKDC